MGLAKAFILDSGPEPVTMSPISQGHVKDWNGQPACDWPVDEISIASLIFLATLRLADQRPETHVVAPRQREGTVALTQPTAVPEIWHSDPGMVDDWPSATSTFTKVPPVITQPHCESLGAKSR